MAWEVSEYLLSRNAMLIPSASLAFKAPCSLVTETFPVYPAGEDVVIFASISVIPWSLSVRLAFVGCLMFLWLLIVYLQSQ